MEELIAVSTEVPKQRGRKVTIKDIARAAGVDPSTVTRALQGSDRVKAATQETIRALAMELGYVPNRAARTLVKATSGLIGVVIPDMTDPFFRDLGRGIEDEALRRERRVLFHDTRAVESSEQAAIGLFRELEVDGLIVPMARSAQAFFDSLADLPVVHVNREEAPHHVSCDRLQGSMQVMRHLLDLGHRRIGFVRGPGPPGVDPKWQAYQLSLREAGLAFDPGLVFAFDSSPDCSSAIVDQLLCQNTRPSAVFAYNDMNAIVMIHELRSRGIRVPADISIAGHDNIQLSGFIDPPVTTVSWPMYELGCESVRYIDALVRGTAPPDSEVPSPTLVVRGSTGAPCVR